MENRASYTLVGAFVLVVLLAGAAFAVWLARFELKEERTFYYIYFRGSVAGLSEGSAVRLRGVPVGTVTGIAIDQRNVELIEVTIALKAGTPVKTDTTATLASQGITGVAYVSLTGGSNAAAPLLPREGKRRATIPSVASPLEKLFEEAPNVIASTGIVAARAAALLSEDNVARIASILRSVDDLATTLAARGAAEAARQLADDARAAMARVEREATAAIGDTRVLLRDADRLVTGAQPLLGDLRQGAQGFARLATQAEALVRDTRGPLRGFADQGLHEFSQFVVEARQLVAALQRLSLQMERDPARFLFGDQTRGFDPSRREQVR
jgi:phospholipid/cholesterol/gamma-HCH transport system substrate-binding protein